MKITIEPTEEDSIDVYSTAIISTRNDDLTMRQLWDDLIQPAILAISYQPHTIEKLILELAEEIEDSPRI